jgi:hypothetical protein
MFCFSNQDNLVVIDVTSEKNRTLNRHLKWVCISFFVDFVKGNYVTVSRGSSVGIVCGYGLDDRAIEVRSPAEAKGFFL